ncbi:MAG: hypothetical protein K2R93_14830 [Gemmatimonadaceae bacterium]|nr:hypothetical protein [Gemmatimonadaceae bacterium]
MLDGEIADAPVCIEHARRREGAGGAGVEAAGAGAAAIGVEGGTDLERELEQQRGEKEMGAGPRRDEHRVLAEPAEPRALGEIALQNGAAIHVRPGIDGMPHFGFQPPMQVAHAFAKHGVVVVATRIARHRTGRRAPAVRGRHDHGVGGPGVRPARIRAERRPVSGEIVHGAVEARVEPRGERRERLGHAQGRDAHSIESQAVRVRHQPARE